MEVARFGRPLLVFAFPHWRIDLLLVPVKANEGTRKADESRRAITGGGVRSMGDHPFDKQFKASWQD